MTYRLERFNSLLQQEISDILQRQLKDPRLGSFVSITSVEVAADLRHARVFVSTMGSQDAKHDTIAALTSAVGFIRKELMSRIKARHIPDLTFRMDERIEQADRVLRIMDHINKEENPKG
ncbi:MAG TPA: 30S ribosome-binding factor RbfA [Dehalococcoidales bacterium]|nr:30S ribosome-binding factor RbfA [Dehalococcoidales bacterium]